MTEPKKPSEWAEMATPSELRVAEMMAARDYSLRALVIILLLFFGSMPYIFIFSTILAIVLSNLWYSDATDAEDLLGIKPTGSQLIFWSMIASWFWLIIGPIIAIAISDSLTVNRYQGW